MKGTGPCISAKKNGGRERAAGRKRPYSSARISPTVLMSGSFSSGTRTP